MSALAGKGAALLVSAIVTPVALRYLGPEQYGLWITITTTVTMLIVLDFGIANTLTNLISSAYARNDKKLASSYFATAFWTVAALCSFLGLAALATWAFIPWKAILNFSSPSLTPEVSRSFAAAYVIFLFAIPAGLASRLLGGYQELHVSNWFGGLGWILSLAGVVTAVLMHGSLVSLVAGFAAGPVAANAACLVWLCGYRKPWLRPSLSKFTRGHLSTIFASGSQFFLIQIAGLIVFNSDNIVITHFLGAAQVTPYSVTWRLTSYAASLQAILTLALWPAYSEAYARNDYPWIRRTYLRMQRVTLSVLCLGATAMAILGKPIIYLWAGSSAVPSAPLLYLMCAWMVVYGITMNQSCLMGATNHVARQAMFSVLAAAANIGLTVLWVRPLGQAGVILGSLVSYLVFVVFVQSRIVANILRRSEVPPKELIGATT
jgi:O-antigen/teichoic acid export membrane protein